MRGGKREEKSTKAGGKNDAEDLWQEQVREKQKWRRKVYARELEGGGVRESRREKMRTEAGDDGEMLESLD